MRLSIIIPAFNEEAYLPETLEAIEAAVDTLRSRPGVSVETFVVDNNSTDATAAAAQAHCATVVSEPVQGIARARNAGARHSQGDVLVFIDADVIIPPNLLERIHAAMSDPQCLGGGTDVDYRPRRLAMRIYLRLWRGLGRMTNMVQGAAQFCRREAFEQIGGYDETAWIGEDVDFYWALRRLARKSGGSTQLIRHPRVRASPRRYDRWPVWKVLLWTNPLFIALFRRRRSLWGAWYSRPVR